MAPFTGQQYSILLLEPVAGERERLRTLLFVAGYYVVAPACGREGLEAARHARPSLVIIDQDMTGMAAPAFLTAFGRMRYPPPVLVTALQPSRDAALQLLHLGAAGLLLKPLSGPLLCKRVGAVIAARRRIAPAGPLPEVDGSSPAETIPNTAAGSSLEID